MDAYALVRETIYRSTIALDRQDWNGWLTHCDEAFQYAIRSWSPEINKDLTYLALDRNGLASMIKLQIGRLWIRKWPSVLRQSTTHRLDWTSHWSRIDFMVGASSLRPAALDELKRTGGLIGVPCRRARPGADYVRLPGVCRHRPMEGSRDGDGI